MSDASDAEDRRQDPRVDRLRPDPSEPPQPAKTLSGLWGNSDRPGFRRLYFTSTLDSYAEFRVEDVLATADVPADQPPFLGEQATRVTLRRDAAVDITRSRRVAAVDEFDLDVRFGFGFRGGLFPFDTNHPDFCIACATGGEDTCGPVTPGTCQDTCGTCETNCGPFTCVQTCQTCGETFCHHTCVGDTCEVCPPRR